MSETRPIECTVTVIKAVVGNFGSIHAKPQDRSSKLWPSATNWSRHGGGTMKAALQNYQGRMRRGLGYIYPRLYRGFGLGKGGGVWALSKYHFHHQLSAAFPLSRHPP